VEVRGVAVVCFINISDIILNKVLDQPHKFMDLLTNMYYHSRDKRDRYKNTRIAKTFEILDLYFSMHK
jgi:hypothetical protein